MLLLESGGHMALTIVLRGLRDKLFLEHCVFKYYAINFHPLVYEKKSHIIIICYNFHSFSY